MAQARREKGLAVQQKLLVTTVSETTTFLRRQSETRIKTYWDSIDLEQHVHQS